MFIEKFTWGEDDMVDIFGRTEWVRERHRVGTE